MQFSIHTSDSFALQAVQEHAHALGAEVSDDRLRQYVEQTLPEEPIEELMSDLTSLAVRDSDPGFHADVLVQIFAVKQEIAHRARY